MLPIRFAGRLDALRPASFVVVDGCPLGAADDDGDLHLAHWPGNRTPAALKRDLSTEIAFAFNALDAEERAAYLAGKDAFVLNHYDTDGVCALLVLTEPDFAAQHEALLNQVAGAGDFFLAASTRAVAVDAALRNLAAPERSAFAVSVAGLAPDERKQRLVDEALNVLREMLQDPAARQELWADDVASFEADKVALERATFDDLIYLDYGVWTASSANIGSFDPCRHALFKDGRQDRVLVLGPSEHGTTARLVVGTRSFFDVVSGPASGRPDLEALARGLNGAEGKSDTDDVRWHAQPQLSASPELWFGTAGLPLYAPRAGEWLRPSQLPAIEIKRHVADAIRDAWVLPDDDDEAEEGEDIFAV